MINRCFYLQKFETLKKQKHQNLNLNLILLNNKIMLLLFISISKVHSKSPEMREDTTEFFFNHKYQNF